MIKLALILLVIGLIAAALGFGGLGGIAMNVGWILLAVGVILLLIHAIRRATTA